MTSPTRTSEVGSAPERGVVVWGWSGCPSHDDAIARLRDVLVELGRPDEPVDVRWVENDEDAVAARFVGSPTIRVDGVDIVPPASDDGFGLTCRVYRTVDGRFSPLPERDVVLSRLRELLG